MARWLKISLKIVSAIFILIILTWLASAFYISRNKKEILSSILGKLNKNLNGEITATGMEPTLLKSFPGVSVSLNGVLLRDSLYNQHKHDLLKAQDIDVSLNVLSLIVGDVNINQIAINNASIYIYTDTNGYSNTSIFKSKATKTEKTDSKTPDFAVRKIDLNKVNLVIENKKRFKLFNFNIDQVQGRLKYPDSGWTGKIRLRTMVNSFAFNTRKGSFLKDKVLDGTLSAHYSRKDDAVILEPEILKIGEHPFKIGARIDLAKAGFNISIAVDQILFKDVAMLLSPNISSKLLKFGIEKPIDIRGNIIDDGSGKYGDPLIKVGIKVRDNVVSIPAGQLTAANFDGSFTNQDTLGGIIGDENSSIKFHNLTAKYFNAPLKIDSFTVNNLARPIATGLVTSQFPLTNLNNSIGTNDFEFKNGTADVKLYCKADIDNFRFTKPVVSGAIKIANADILYIPRKLHLIKSALNINFNQNNLIINNGHFQLGKSELNVNCNIANFANLYYTDPEKIVVNLSMYSPQLYLNEFLPFLGPRTVKKKSKSTGGMKTASKELSNVLELSKMNIQLKVDKAIYDKFTAKNLNADVSLRGSGIYFNKISVAHAGGLLTLDGNIIQETGSNVFKINSKISHVSVKDFFYSFDNFGQNTITNKNLQGYLSSLVNISGRISHAGKILPRSINGKVAFNLKNAALVNFEPMVKVGKFAFANRNLSDVRINNLDGTLIVKGDKVEIKPMQINSSALNFNVKGIYALNTGTNVEMDIPLRNPKGDENLTNKEKREARMKGIVLHLKAIDDEKGGIKIRWNKEHD
ncbi:MULTISPECIES: AsmA-like C-terminal region-containing protein [unclassified Pedobacter]|uniref:AsmA-like C-terminal region-containing protein n=1 Tax=unclassified Pedobacter TaxID=2628915 RepID=UPI001E571614|nr:MULTISPECIES: AsmA-like C-terminal region-containing protein [unclassified Pedobacter]